jgi:hypothetical protein
MSSKQLWGIIGKQSIITQNTREEKNTLGYLYIKMASLLLYLQKTGSSKHGAVEFLQKL